MYSSNDLYQIVAEYSDLGEHRCGAEVDRATIDWLSEHVRQAGGRVERQPFTFDRYDADWEVRVDDRPVQSIPLFYEGVGQVRTDDPATMVWEPGLSNTGLDSVFNDFSRRAIEHGSTAAVVATGSQHGLLHAVNRQPVLGSGLPTLLVPGALGNRLESAEIEVELRAQIVPGESANVIGHFGAGPIEDSVVITTPISGWFRCAGERGTGIAVALAAAEALAAQTSVLFIGAGGHELHHQGAQKALADLDGVPRAIVHIGASVAAAADTPVDGLATLTEDLLATVSTGPQEYQRVAEILNGASIRTAAPEDPTSPDSWSGEAKNWAHFGKPLFSLVGGFPLFHAPEDTVERATTPALLESVSMAVTSAVQILTH